MKSLLLAAMLCVTTTSATWAQGTAKPAPLTDAQKVEKFSKMMAMKVLTGNYASDRGPASAPARKDEYRIESVTHVEGTSWTVNTRVKYEMYNVLVPVPVQVEWAGDTPMIQVTNLTIPNLGSGFTARVLIYEGRYAGTWAHNQVGGQMWGTLKDYVPEQPAAPGAEPPKMEAPAGSNLAPK